MGLVDRGFECIVNTITKIIRPNAQRVWRPKCVDARMWRTGTLHVYSLLRVYRGLSVVGVTTVSRRPRNHRAYLLIGTLLRHAGAAHPTGIHTGISR